MPSQEPSSYGAIRAPVELERLADRYPRVARAVQLPQRSVLTLPTATQHQLSIGSCVGQMWAKLAETIIGTGLEVSALALYFFSRIESNPAWERQDTGALMGPSIRAMQKHGFGSEALWRYDISKFAERPPPEYLVQALDHRLLKVRLALTVSEVKAAIDAGHPAGTAFDVQPEFDREMRADGLWRDTTGRTVGGHAVTIYGYDDDLVAGPGYDTGSLLCVNSWGDAYGEDLHDNPNMGGGFRVPYSVFDDTRGRFWDGIVPELIDVEAGE